MNSRCLAARILGQVVGEGVSLSAALEAVLPQCPTEQDRAFVQALCYGVLRSYERLDALLGQLLVRPIKAIEVRMLALLGLYQLEYMRVKPYAAVSETVAAAGRYRWAKSLLNGILRTYQRRREVLLSKADENESARLNHPRWLIERIRRDWLDQADGLIAEAGRPPPLTLRVNRLKLTRAEYLFRLHQRGIEASPGLFSPDAVILGTPLPVDRLPGFSEGLVSVQDEAAQLAAGLLDLKGGQRLLDLCAAPGGKTLHALETCPDLAEVVALDIAPERIARLHDNLARAGLSATVLSADAAKPDEWWDGRLYDRILLDAPCSATGVIRRHPDIKRLRRPEDIVSLCREQRRLLEVAWRLLAPGGLLVYATCSVLKVENEAQIAAFVQSHPEATPRLILASWGRLAGLGRQILTGESAMDGFFYACLTK